MNRKALLFYLRELRDLEFASWKTTDILNKESMDFNKKYYDLTHISYKEVPVEKDGWTGDRMLFIACFLFLLIMTLWLVLIVKVWFLFAWILYFFDFVFGIAAIGSIFGAYQEREENKGARKHAERYNERQYEKYVQNKDIAENLRSNWEERSAYLAKEYSKVAALLKSNYDLNIIPSQYRNIASIYYIYDYMSTSNASLEETLIHEHMENGIQRILEKLDYIIEQNYELIMQNRRIEATNQQILQTNQQILQTNQQMLKQLEAVEEQAYIATQYAELSANYNEATAYFSLANYLK